MRTRRQNSSGYPVSSYRPASANASAGRHQPVLLHEVIQALAIGEDNVVVDATLGGAGHARAIAQVLGKQGALIGFDLDQDAIARAKDALAHAAPKTCFIRANFRHIATEVEKIGITRIDKVLFDLGWSSYQLDAGRGFSFLADEPLSMTYASPSEGESVLRASTIVNTWSEESLADIFFGWGEERYARGIAKRIVERRVRKPFETARELAEVIKEAVPARYRHGRIHPATRTFQALRIAVNDELGALKEGLAAAWQVLAPGGRIAVITFHSIEDRIVKQALIEWEKQGEGERITRKPIRPTVQEIAANPRARSAKLRVIQKR